MPYLSRAGSFFHDNSFAELCQIFGCCERAEAVGTCGHYFCTGHALQMVCVANDTTFFMHCAGCKKIFLVDDADIKYWMAQSCPTHSMMIASSNQIGFHLLSHEPCPSGCFDCDGSQLVTAHLNTHKDLMKYLSLCVIQMLWDVAGYYLWHLLWKLLDIWDALVQHVTFVGKRVAIRSLLKQHGRRDESPQDENHSTDPAPGAKDLAMNSPITVQSGKQKTGLHGNDDLCVICNDSPRTHAITPCGHRCLCGTCAVTLKQQQPRSRKKKKPVEKCPLCRQGINQIIRIFE